MFQHPKEDLQLLRSEPVPIDIWHRGTTNAATQQYHDM
jgi:hypothetical protein